MNYAETAIEILRETYIGTPLIKHVRRSIDLHFSNHHGAAQSKCMLIVGSSGSGKTQLIQQYMKQKMKDASQAIYVSEGNVIRPLKFVYVETPPRATLKGLAEAVLMRLGDPFPSKGGGQSMTMRIIDLLRLRGADGVILDEFQHLIDRRGSSDKIAHEAADWVKGLLNEAHCPFLLVGTEPAEDVIESNEQLRRRCTSIWRLMAFGFGSREERAAFKAILLAFEERLALPKSSELGSDDMAARIHYATFGLIGHVTRLLEAALFLELDRKLGCLTMDTLSDAFAQSRTRNDRRVNPFRTKEPPTLSPNDRRFGVSNLKRKSRDPEAAVAVLSGVTA